MDNTQFYRCLIAGLRSVGVCKFLTHRSGVQDGLEAAIKKAEELGINVDRLVTTLAFLKTGDNYGLLTPYERTHAEITLTSQDSGRDYLIHIAPDNAGAFQPIAEAFLAKYNETIDKEKAI